MIERAFDSRSSGPLAGDPNRDFPESGDVGLSGIKRPRPGGIFLERHVGLRGERYGAGDDFGEFGLAELGSLPLLLKIERSISAKRDQLANHDQREQKNAQ